MTAAAARTSGMLWPFSSVLNFGVMASRNCARLFSRASSRARAEARARASVARRALEAFAEYAVFRAVVRVAVVFELRDALRCAASADVTESGRQRATPRSVETTLETNTGR